MLGSLAVMEKAGREVVGGKMVRFFLHVLSLKNRQISGSRVHERRGSGDVSSAVLVHGWSLTPFSPQACFCCAILNKPSAAQASVSLTHN